MIQSPRSPQIKMMVDEIQEMRALVDSLLKTKHYQRLGAEGIFAIIQKAQATNVNPLDALNGGMYYVQGKVEMSAFLMNQLIRQAGHSISKDEKSSETECILHGKRADTGDIGPKLSPSTMQSELEFIERVLVGLNTPAICSLRVCFLT